MWMDLHIQPYNMSTKAVNSAAKACKLLVPCKAVSECLNFCIYANINYIPLPHFVTNNWGTNATHFDMKACLQFYKS